MKRCLINWDNTKAVKDCSEVQNLIDSGTKTILIVEDDSLMRGLLEKIVEREGDKTRGADSAEQALEVFDPAAMGLVISDLEMPGMNGLELLKAIREKARKQAMLIATGKSYKYDKWLILVTKYHLSYRVASLVLRSRYCQDRRKCLERGSEGWCLES